VLHVAHRCRKKAYCHDSYVVPITTWEGHLKHLKHLIWKRRNESAGLKTFFHLKSPQKLSFWRGALPITLSRSADAPPYTIREHYNTPLALLRQRYRFWERWRPLKPTRERYNALMALLREHYLFWAVVKRLRWMGEASFHSWKVVGFESLVQPWS
jgi:hypothetical protein